MTLPMRANLMELEAAVRAQLGVDSVECRVSDFGGPPLSLLASTGATFRTLGLAQPGAKVFAVIPQLEAGADAFGATPGNAAPTKPAAASVPWAWVDTVAASASNVPHRATPTTAPTELEHLASTLGAHGVLLGNPDDACATNTARATMVRRSLEKEIRRVAHSACADEEARHRMMAATVQDCAAVATGIGNVEDGPAAVAALAQDSPAACRGATTEFLRAAHAQDVLDPQWPGMAPDQLAACRPMCEPRNAMTLAVQCANELTAWHGDAPSALELPKGTLTSRLVSASFHAASDSVRRSEATSKALAGASLGSDMPALGSAAFSVGQVGLSAVLLASVKADLCCASGVATLGTVTEVFRAAAGFTRQVQDVCRLGAVSGVWLRRVIECVHHTCLP